VKSSLTPSLAAESVLWEYGLTCVAGLDEAGRGAWAGPVSAAAVILPPDPSIQDKLTGVRDSKQMSARERDFWEEQIKVLALDWSTGLASSREIDELGILPSTRLAMRRALDGLSLLPKHLLIDAVRLPGVPVPQTALIKGDSLVLSIACASVLAKTCRDAILVQFDKEYPGYAFARHKGYGTARHREALAGLGPCPEHRFSYRPVSSFTRV
jgi:ribonuclease HII